MLKYSWYLTSAGAYSSILSSGIEVCIYFFFSFVGKELKFEDTSAEPELLFYYNNYLEKTGNMKHIRLKIRTIFYLYFPQQKL